MQNYETEKSMHKISLEYKQIMIIKWPNNLFSNCYHNLFSIEIEKELDIYTIFYVDIIRFIYIYFSY